jgi:hypothetical protein
VLGIVGAALAIIGSFTTWAKVGESGFVFRVRGLSGDGKITIALAIIALMLFAVALANGSRGLFIAGLVVMLLATAVFVYHFIRIGKDGFGFVGIGLYLGVIGGAVAVVGSILGISARRA